MGAAGFEAIRPYVETVLQGRPVEWEQHIQLEAVAGEGGIEPGRRILKT